MAEAVPPAQAAPTRPPPVKEAPLTTAPPPVKEAPLTTAPPPVNEAPPPMRKAQLPEAPPPMNEAPVTTAPLPMQEAQLPAALPRVNEASLTTAPPPGAPPTTAPPMGAPPTPVGPQTTAPPPVAPFPMTTPPQEAFTEDKSMVPQMAPEDPKALALAGQNPPTSTKDRNAVLTRVETDKRMSLIKAWEENEKSKAENKAQKKMSSIQSWENTKKAAVEAQLRKMEETLDRKKAEYAEKMQNKAAMVHKEAEERRAHVHALRGQEFVKAEEEAASYRAKGETPRKGGFMCFGC